MPDLYPYGLSRKARTAPGIEAVRSRLREELFDRMLAVRDPLPARERPY